eukprot:UN17599
MTRKCLLGVRRNVSKRHILPNHASIIAVTSPAIQSYMCKNPVILQMHCKIKDLHVHKILQLHRFYTCILKCYEFEISLTKTPELFKL